METLDYIPQESKRPNFLTVLCILTFVGAGIGILSAIWGMATLQSSIRSLEASQNMMGSLGRGFGNMMDSQLDLLKKYGMISQTMNLVGNGLCLFGALLMWRLKKNGFYMYVVGQLLPLIASFAFFGGVDFGMFASLAIAGAIIGAMFPIAFIVMYALNLKHMN